MPPNSPRWLSKLPKLAAFTRSRGAVIHIYSRHGSTALWTPHGVDPAAFRAYDQYYWRVNPLFRPTIMLPIGGVSIDRSTAGRDAYLKSEIFSDWAAPNGIFAAMALKILDGRDQQGVIFFNRTHQQGEFERADVDALKALAAHLTRAAQIGHRLAWSRPG